VYEVSQMESMVVSSHLTNEILTLCVYIQAITRIYAKSRMLREKRITLVYEAVTYLLFDMLTIIIVIFLS